MNNLHVIQFDVSYFCCSFLGHHGLGSHAALMYASSSEVIVVDGDSVRFLRATAVPAGTAESAY